MTPDEYIEATKKFDNHAEVYGDLPYALGMAAESGEVANEYERGMRIGSFVNLFEIRREIGDVLWQIARICDRHGWTFESLMQDNIDKLTERYAREGIGTRDDHR